MELKNSAEIQTKKSSSAGESAAALG